jgi:hypothetical protein
LARWHDSEAGYHTYFDYVNNFRKLNLTKLSDSIYQNRIKIIIDRLLDPHGSKENKHIRDSGIPWHYDIKEGPENEVKDPFGIILSAVFNNFTTPVHKKRMER